MVQFTKLKNILNMGEKVSFEKKSRFFYHLLPPSCFMGEKKVSFELKRIGSLIEYEVIRLSFVNMFESLQGNLCGEFPAL